MSQARLEWLISRGDMRDHGQLLELLWLLGHFGERAWNQTASLSANSFPFGEAVKSYQRFSQDDQQLALAVDGEFGPISQASVRGRFCACPDILPAGGSYWNRQFATTGDGLIIWHDMDYTSLDEKEIYIRAFESWGQASGTSGLRGRWFREGDPRANIWSRVRRIDGPGGVLGWSMLPPANASETHDIEQRMDIADPSNLAELDAHELGHAIGHGHYPNSAGQRYLMNPYLQPGITGPQGKEITLTQQMYGKATGGDPDPDPDPPPGDPTDEILGEEMVGKSADGRALIVTYTLRAFDED